MYREPAASPSNDEVLHRSTVGLSDVVLGVLASAPVFLGAMGLLVHDVGRMVALSTPFVVAFLVLYAGRTTTTITAQAVHAKRFFLTRTLAYADAARLVVPHASLAGLAVSKASRLAASLLLYGIDGRMFVLPGDVPIAVRLRVAQAALPPAVKRAEELVAGGGTYRDPDGLSSLDETTLRGIRVGMVVNGKGEAPLAEITLVDAAGSVHSSGERFLVAGNDLVLRRLLVRRGIENDVRGDVAELLETSD